MQEFIDDRFMLLTRMSILAMCAQMKFKVNRMPSEIGDNVPDGQIHQPKGQVATRAAKTTNRHPRLFNCFIWKCTVDT
jgi:hypothetical protein